jgi:hypothetical protein
MITSTRTPAGAGDIEISDLAATGLAVPSRIRAAKIATVEPSRFINRIGQLSVLELLPLSERLKRYLAR